MAAVEEEGDSLEFFLNKATDPSKVDQDHNAVMSFCDRINNDFEGPQMAVRLLAHKIQSPQEREAMHALMALEACVQNCGGRFHQELGKFRFLNELIKVVSPKYLGNYSSESVKKRTIELMFAWSSGLPHEPKIKEAYSMLKKQGIVTVDPVLHDVPPLEVPPPRTSSIFEDHDESQQLARLLKSRNPEDLQAANRLIKNMVKQDMEKTEKRSKRMQELDTVNNNIKLLTEMLQHYSQNSQNSTQSDKEILKELYDSLEKRRPVLFRLASDTDSKENDAMMEILKTNDAVVKVMQQYKKIVEGGGDENGLLLQTDGATGQSGGRSNMEELGDIFGGGTASASAAATAHTDILGLSSMQSPPPYSQTHPLHSTTNNTLSSHVAASNANTTSSLLHNVTQGTTAATSAAVSDDISLLDTSSSLAAASGSGGGANNSLTDLNSVFSNAGNSPNVMTGILPQPMQAVTSTPSVPQQQQQQGAIGAGGDTKRKGVFSELENISQSLIKQQLGDSAVTSKPFVPSSQPVQRLSLKEMQSVSQQQHQQKLLQQQGVLAPTTTAPAAISATPMNTAPTLQPLTDVHVALETIQPGGKPSLTACDKNDIKIVIHFGKDRPRADVQVMVVSVMSTKQTPVKHFKFQAAVPKTMKLKLQPASATDLPAFNPILPSAAITQVMLVANPQNDKIRIKYKISYSVNDQTESDMGDIDVPQ